MSSLATAAGSVTAAALITFSAFGSAATAAASPVDPADMQTLMSHLSEGFNADNCHETATSRTGQLAAVQCEQDSDPNGPSDARFTLYADNASMDSVFNEIVSDDELLTCHDGWRLSPTTWHDQSSGGKLSCGTYEDEPELVWTNDATSVMGSIYGLDTDGLFTWWQTKG